MVLLVGERRERESQCNKYVMHPRKEILKKIQIELTESCFFMLEAKSTELHKLKIILLSIFC